MGHTCPKGAEYVYVSGDNGTQSAWQMSYFMTQNTYLALEEVRAGLQHLFPNFNHFQGPWTQ